MFLYAEVLIKKSHKLAQSVEIRQKECAVFLKANSCKKNRETNFFDFFDNLLIIYNIF